MLGRWTLRGVAVAAALGSTLLFGPTAWASSTVNINSGNVPTTAAGYDSHGCDFGGGPFANQDVWVFVLPSFGGTSGQFTSVTAHFDTDGNGTADTDVTIPTDGGAIVNNKGTSKAWIATSAGWTLVGASAVITGTARFFNLTHTCPATGTPTPSPSSSSPSTSHSPSPTGSGSASLAADSTPNSTGSIGIGLAAIVLAGAGATLWAMRRRRDAEGH